MVGSPLGFAFFENGYHRTIAGWFMSKAKDDKGPPGALATAPGP
jgi:hypothetical protein